jgi:hypothetical protein
MGLGPQTVWTCFQALRALLILFKTMNKTLSALLPVLFPILLLLSISSSSLFYRKTIGIWEKII